jgi:predicted RNase H-like HicB family nuclease
MVLILKLKIMQIRVLLEWDDEVKAYSATCPELNFVSSCGESKKEAIENLKEAINLMLEPIPKQFVDSKIETEELQIMI